MSDRTSKNGQNTDHQGKRHYKTPAGLYQENGGKNSHHRRHQPNPDFRQAKEKSEGWKPKDKTEPRLDAISAPTGIGLPKKHHQKISLPFQASFSPSFSRAELDSLRSETDALFSNPTEEQAGCDSLRSLKGEIILQKPEPTSKLAPKEKPLVLDITPNTSTALVHQRRTLPPLYREGQKALPPGKEMKLLPQFAQSLLEREAQERFKEKFDEELHQREQKELSPEELARLMQGIQGSDPRAPSQGEAAVPNKPFEESRKEEGTPAELEQKRRRWKGLVTLLPLVLLAFLNEAPQRANSKPSAAPVGDDDRPDILLIEGKNPPTTVGGAQRTPQPQDFTRADERWLKIGVFTKVARDEIGWSQQQVDADKLGAITKLNEHNARTIERTGLRKEMLGREILGVNITNDNQLRAGAYAVGVGGLRQASRGRLGNQEQQEHLKMALETFADDPPAPDLDEIVKARVLSK